MDQYPVGPCEHGKAHLVCETCSKLLYNNGKGIPYNEAIEEYNMPVIKNYGETWIRLVDHRRILTEERKRIANGIHDRCIKLQNEANMQDAARKNPEKHHLTRSGGYAAGLEDMRAFADSLTQPDHE